MQFLGQLQSIGRRNCPGDQRDLASLRRYSHLGVKLLELLGSRLPLGIDELCHRLRIAYRAHVTSDTPLRAKPRAMIHVRADQASAFRQCSRS